MARADHGHPCRAATAEQDGCLQPEDFERFDSKQAGLANTTSTWPIRFVQDSTMLTLAACASGEILRTSPELAWFCDADADSLASLGTTCAIGYLPKWMGNGWECAADKDGLGALSASCPNNGEPVFSTTTGNWGCIDRGHFDSTPTVGAGNATVWHASNDGAGSGLDADLVDGLEVRDYIMARGMNLVANGSGMMGTNYNFTGFAFFPQDLVAGKGSFFSNTLSGWKSNDELISVDPSRFYKASANVKGLPVTTGSRFYMGGAFYDIDGNVVSPQYHMRRPGTDTTLAQPLAPGDTVVHLTSAANWYASDGATYYRSLQVWGYKNSYGYQYPPYTYTRNIGYDTWPAGGVDYVANTVTLNAPWPSSRGNPDDPAGIWPAGTPVSNGWAGATYKYFAANGISTPTDWTFVSGVIGGVDLSGTNLMNKFPPGSAYMRIMFYVNYQAAAGAGTLVNSVWLSEVTPENIASGSIWTTANDGTGSGLDADLLDGKDSSAFTYYGDTNRGITIDAHNAVALNTCDEGQVQKAHPWGSWYCADDNDLLGGMSCAAGDVPQLNNGVWSCSQVVPAAGALAADPGDCAEGEFASAIDSQGNLSCAPVQGPMISGSVTNALTADALSADPLDCGSGQFATGIAANGDLTCGTVSSVSTAGSLSADPTDCAVGSFAKAIDAHGNLTCSTVPASSVTGTVAQAMSAYSAVSLITDPGDCAAGQFAVEIDSYGELTCQAPPVASGSQAGYLSAADYSYFFGKENPLTFSTGLSRVGNTVSCVSADDKTTGCVTTSAQTIAGLKDFPDGISAYNVATGEIVSGGALTLSAQSSLEAFGKGGVGISSDTGPITLSPGSGNPLVVDSPSLQSPGSVAHTFVLDVSSSTAAQTMLEIDNLGGIESSFGADLNIANGSLKVGGTERIDKDGNISAASLSASSWGSHSHTGSTTGGTLSITSATYGTLTYSRGGTGTTASPTAGGVAYGTGSAILTTSAGSSGQVLTSNGTSAPTWQDATARKLVRTTTTQSTSSVSGIYPISLPVTTSSNYGFHCVLLVSGQASSGPKVGVYAPTGSSTVYKANKFLTSRTTMASESVIGGSWTASCSAGCTTETTAWTLDGNVTTGSTSGDIRIYFGATVNGQYAYLYPGSFCVFY